MEKKEVTKKRYNRKKRKRAIKKSKKVVIAMGLTAIVLVVATYAWFIGITTVNVNQFEVNIVTTEGLSISLDGKHWETVLNVTKGIIEGTDPMVINGSTSANKHLKADGTDGDYGEYPVANGNNDHWATAGDDSSHTGLEPVSSSGQLDSTSSQAKFYSKSTMTAERGGYKLAAGDITSPTATGYIAFDIFIRNATGSAYEAAYNKDNDEALFLTGGSNVTYNTSGSSAGDGIQNSVRVGFYSLGRVAATGTTDATIQGISCSASTGVTSLCNLQEGEAGSQTAVPRGYNWNIWEPNDTAHTDKAITRFNNACIKRSSTGEYQLTGDDNKCKPIGEGASAQQLSDNTYIKTFTINDTISASANPPANIYDGLNGYTNPKMSYIQTLTDTENSTEDTRSPLLFIAPSSITKIRVYIYLEGQDVDNFDLATVYQTLRFEFGFTKDRYEAAEEETPTPTTGE